MTMSDEQPIGPYRIEREIGRGGMGVVYLARDERLDRDVAIKALPEGLSGDAARLERFEREARALAQLNHPNVAGIYGLEEQDGRRYLVLEYVEGDTLEDRIDQGPLSLDDALDFAVHIAAGVEAAHEAGIIHRDLKPANIKITPEGVAKVLDFGLARADEPAASSSSTDLAASPTIPAGGPHSPTIPGAVLGTAPYMSPEQARGRRVDRRTDVWSFGVILYEMLTGISPFDGETATDSIGAILHKGVDLDRLPPGTPPMVRHVLARCLDRDKTRRYRDIGDIRIELAMVEAGPRQGVTRPAGGVSVARLVGAAMITLLIGAGAAWLLKPAPVRARTAVAHLSMVLPWERERVSTFAMSPDGQTLAFVVREETNAAPEWGVYTRRLDGIDFERVHTIRNRPLSIAFTPDGRELVLADTSESLREFVYRLSLTDGRPVSLVDGDVDRFDIGNSQDLWLNDDEFLLHGQDTDAREVYAISRHDGTVRPLVSLPAGGRWSSIVSVSPDGRRALYRSITTQDDRFATSIHLLDLTTGAAVDVASRSSQARFLTPDTIAFVRDAQWFATRFDPETGAIGGTLLPLAAPTSVLGPAAVGAGSGHLAFFGDGAVRGQIALLERDGSSTTLFAEPRWYGASSIRSSPDGAWIGAVYGERQQDDRPNMAVFDVDTARPRVITSGSVVIAHWLRDGRLLYVANPTASAAHERSLHADVMSWHPERGVETLLSQFPMPSPSITATPDGSRIVVVQRVDDADRPAGLAADDDVYLAVIDPTAPDRATTVYYSSGGWEDDPMLSPDGRWLAFAAGNGARQDVFVTPFDPDAPPRPVQVSTNGGEKPFWSHDGSELFFYEVQADRTTGALMGATFTAGDPPAISTPSRIVEADAFDGGTAAPWSDGQRFVYVDTPDPRPEDEHLHIVLHWRDDILRRLAE